MAHGLSLPLFVTLRERHRLGAPGGCQRAYPCSAASATVLYAVVCYTSGTTGHAKGAMLTHRNVITNCKQVDASEHLKGLLPADVVLLVLPLFHIYALNVSLTMALRAGATIVLVARFEECRSVDHVLPKALNPGVARGHPRGGDRATAARYSCFRTIASRPIISTTGTPSMS